MRNLVMMPGLVLCLALSSCWTDHGFFAGNYSYGKAVAEHGAPTSEETIAGGRRVARWDSTDAMTTEFPVQDEATGEITGSRPLSIETHKLLELRFDRDGILESHDWKANVDVH